MKRLRLDYIEPHTSIHIELILLIEQPHILFTCVYFFVKDFIVSALCQMLWRNIIEKF